MYLCLDIKKRHEMPIANSDSSKMYLCLDSKRRRNSESKNSDTSKMYLCLDGLNFVPAFELIVILVKCICA